MHRIGVVGCGKKKNAKGGRADQLYTGVLFRFSREYVRHNCHEWVILSALHGLLSPSDFVLPYDHKAKRSPGGEGKAQWRALVEQQARERWGARLQNPEGTLLVVMAGGPYVDALRGLGFAIHEPMKGLTVGRRTAWLSRARKDNWECQ